MTTKEKTIIKRYFKQNTAVKPGYYETEKGYIITNHYGAIRFNNSRADIVTGLNKLDNTNISNTLNNAIDNDMSSDYTYHVTTVNIEDLKTFKAYAKRNKKPFVIPYADNKYFGINPLFLIDIMDLMHLKTADILAYDSKSPVIISSGDIKAIICPVAISKDYDITDYSKFKALLVELKCNQEQEKAAKKANKAAGIIPTITAGKKYNGFVYNIGGVDYFYSTDKKTITDNIARVFINTFCDKKNINDNLRARALNDKNTLKGFKKRIDRATLEYIPLETSNTAYIDITTKNSCGGCMLSEAKDHLYLIDCKLPGTTETKETTTPDNCTVKDDTCTATDTANNDGVTATQDIKTADTTTQDTSNNAITSETMQADATQDKPHKTSKKAMCLFIVTDKPAPVKLPTLKQLDRIPMYVERFKTDLQPLKSHRVYKYRANNKKTLKKAYNDFVGTVSMNCDKYAIGGKVAAVNSS